MISTFLFVVHLQKETEKQITKIKWTARKTTPNGKMKRVVSGGEITNSNKKEIGNREQGARNKERGSCGAPPASLRSRHGIIGRRYGPAFSSNTRQ